MKKIILLVLLLIGHCGLAQTSTQIDPATRINWPRITGPGTPTIVGFPCSTGNIGQPYLDTATTPNTGYVCGMAGWQFDVSSGALQPTSSSNQTVTQASGTTLAVNSLNNVVNVFPGTSLPQACGSTPTTVQITTPITLAPGVATTILPTCTLLFESGGQVLGPGNTLTINGQVQAAAGQQIFGSGLLVQGLRQQVSLLWFGAVPDCVNGLGACTDNIAPMQAALNSLVTGGQVICPVGDYAFTGPLVFPYTAAQMGIGWVGQTSSQDPSGCRLLNKSASADSMQIEGGNGSLHNLVGDDVKNVTLTRLLTPTGTATGLRQILTGGGRVENVASNESIHGFWNEGVPDYATGGNYHSSCSWTQAAFTGVNYTAGTVVDCVHVDGTYAPDSMTLNNLNAHDFTNASANSLASTGVAMSGGDVSDVYIQWPNMANLGIGISIDCGAGGVTFANDIIISNPILEDGQGLYVNGCGASQDTNITMSNGWVSSNGFDTRIVNSANVAISGMQFTGAGQNSVTGSTGVSFSGNKGDGGGGGYDYTNTSDSPLTGNTVENAEQTAFNFVNSSNNPINGNATAGTATSSVGVTFDATSTSDCCFGNNDFSTSATPYIDISEGNTNFGPIRLNQVQNPSSGTSYMMGGYSLQYVFNGVYPVNMLSMIDTTANTGSADMLNLQVFGANVHALHTSHPQAHSTFDGGGHATLYDDPLSGAVILGAGVKGDGTATLGSRCYNGGATVPGSGGWLYCNTSSSAMAYAPTSSNVVLTVASLPIAAQAGNGYTYQVSDGAGGNGTACAGGGTQRQIAMSNGTTWYCVGGTLAAITGGTIDGTVIGATTPAAGSFTSGTFATGNPAVIPMSVTNTSSSAGLATPLGSLFAPNSSNALYFLVGKSASGGNSALFGYASSCAFMTPYGNPATQLQTCSNGVTSAGSVTLNDGGGGYKGLPTAPTGACTDNGAWVLSQDGHATFCASGTWVVKI